MISASVAPSPLPTGGELHVTMMISGSVELVIFGVYCIRFVDV